MTSGPQADAIAILLVDDDDVDRMAVRRLLAPALRERLVEAKDADGALARLGEARFDCVLLDYNLPRVDGLQMLREIRTRGVTTPVVVLTGQGDERLAVALMKGGAADYLAKSELTAERLAQSVGHAVRVHRAELDVARGQRRIERLHGLMAALGAAHTTQEVARVVVDDGRRAFDIERMALAALAPDGRSVEILHTSGFPQSAKPAGATVTLDESQALAEAVISEAPAFLEQDGLLVLPLLVGPRVIGILSARDLRLRDTLEDERPDLVAFARVAAQSLDRALLFDLAQAERQRAEEASRTKDEFLAVVSHELRTPLNAMLGWATMLATGALRADEIQKAGETIERNARAQAQIIEDLLDVSRIVSGKLKLELATFDVAPLLAESLDVVRAAADAKGVTLSLDVARDLEPLRGDAERLRQVFWNLMSNGVKFTPRGGRVHVIAERRGDAYVVAVSDTGQGIEPSFLPYVFERFRQQDSGTTRKTGGLGLGLAIVRNIVEAHGGSVEVESAGTGQGSVFTVRFAAPAQSTRGHLLPAPPRERLPETTEPGSSAHGELGRLTGARILVVDDEADARELLETILVTYGSIVTCASSAREAFELAEVERFDAVVSDIGMPGEDGYALAARLQTLPRPPPTVALTAFARTEDRTRALEAGFREHATKPFDPRALARLIVGVLPERPAPR